MSDTEWTEEPICPHCFHLHADMITSEWGMSGETNCSCCDKPFFYTREITTDEWTTRTITTSEEGEG